MDDGEPVSEYQGIAAQFARAKALKEKEEAQGLKGNSPDAKASNKLRELQFKAVHGLLVALFGLVFLLHALGIYLFGSGFLLTRLVLDQKSECAVPPVTSAVGAQPLSPTEGCWYPRTFDKAVIIIIDALRYDFTVPFVSRPGDEKPHHFHDALPVFYETAVQQPNNAFLLPFIADPPTTTLQRLKGLTTGTLPTFIDAGSNFAGTAIEEDNLVAQLRDAGRRMVHLGDDTWHSLFPGYFDTNLTRAYDSFNVWDLHTVDNGVTEHLLPLLRSSNSNQWDVIFGHYLGVDHAGHRYGPDHSAMSAKLKQMDDVMRQIIELIDDSTLLVVMGDHGMDAKGDHGGESNDEIEAALWMYSKKGVFGRSSPSLLAPPSNAKERSTRQIDLVSTLSLLLGVPIPFNNLGAPIEEAFIGRDGNDWEKLTSVRRLTAAQIHRYQDAYSLARQSDGDAMSVPLVLWAKATEDWDLLQQSRSPTTQQWIDTNAAFSKYQKETLSICRSLWANFDLTSMVTGIGVSFATLIVLGFYARGVDGDRTLLTPLLLARGAIGTVLGSAGGLISGFTISTSPLAYTAIPCMAAGTLLGIASGLWYARRTLCLPLPHSLWGWVSVVFTVAPCIGFASNSFTIWEDEMLLYLLSTVAVLMLASSLRQEDPRERFLGAFHSISFVVLSRLASLSRLCREEQMPYCKSTYYASTTSSTSSWWQLIIPFLLATFLPSAVRDFYARTRSYQGSAVFWIGFAFRMGLLLSAIYWFLDAADDGEWFATSKDTFKTIRVIVAQLVLGIALAAGYSTFTWAAPLLSVEVSPNKEEDIKAGIVYPITSGSRSAVTILGYANVHGTRYFLLVTLWSLAIILVQKPMGGGAIGLLLLQILTLLEIIDTNKLASTSVGPVVLGLLGSFYFFKTGHQATLASIQWESAFIPLKTIRYPWSPLLVILNTFGAQILCAIAVPATALWKQPPKKKGLVGGVAQAMATHLLFYAVIGLATMVWAGWLRRHLMLYRIFMPRMLMGSAVLLVVDVTGIFVAIGGTRWSFLSVAEVFGWM